MATPAPAPRLRGREAELRALGDAVGRVASGHPAVVLVEGEAGIGKTRLLAETLADARARGLQVVAGRAQELERTRPFGVLADALDCTPASPDPRRRAVAALLATRVGERGDAQTVSSDPGLQFQAVDAFGDLVESLAVTGPLVAGLDDLQWADPSSLLTLGTVPGRLADLPVALVAGLRPSPRPPELERALAALDGGGARRLSLGPLGQDAVAGLVADVLAAEPGERLLAEVAGAGGNPLFVTELVEALRQEGAITAAGGGAELATRTLPTTLRLTILRRLGFLPGDTLLALRAAAILGSGFSLAELSATTGRSALELSSALAEAIRAGVLEEDGERLRFRHDLLREAVYEDLPASVRVALHGEAGRRLARAGAPALQVAEQLARGATPGDPEAVGWLVRAAREAAARSPAVAAELLGRASSLAGPADPGRDRLAVERAGALLQAGAIDEAAALCRALLALHRDDLPAAEAAAARAADELAAGSPRYRSHWATWVRALLLEAGGAVPEADAALAGVWDWCRRSGFALEYPVLGPDLVRLALAAGDRERATRVAAAVAEVAAGSAVPWITGAALRCRGLAAGDPGLLRAAVAAYAAGPRPLELALAAEDAGAALARHGDPAAATSLLRQALAGYERLDAARPAARAEAALRRLGVRRGARGPAAAPSSLGEPDPDRAPGRRPGRRGPLQPPGRRAAVHLPAHRPDPPGPRVRQARPLLAHPAGRRGRPPPPDHPDRLRQPVGGRGCPPPGRCLARRAGGSWDGQTIAERRPSMHPSAKRTTGVIAVAAAAALVIWGIARLFGVDVEVELGGEIRQVGPVDILVAAIVAGLAAWVVYSLLARTPRTARWWPFVGSTAIAVSMLGPSYLSDGAAAVALIAMHFAVGAVLIKGLLEARALGLTGPGPGRGPVAGTPRR